jgi:hypothetical protein
VSIGDGHDFRALAAPGGTDGEAPFFAPAKVASTKASSECNWPRRCSSAASRRSTSSSLPSRTHCWKRRWQVWYGGYFEGNSRHCAPVPSTHSTPFSTARVSCQGRPRPSRRRFGSKIGSSSFHCASLTSQRPRMPCFVPAKLLLHKRFAPRQLFMRPVLELSTHPANSRVVAVRSASNITRS